MHIRGEDMIFEIPKEIRSLLTYVSFNYGFYSELIMADVIPPEWTKEILEETHRSALQKFIDIQEIVSKEMEGFEWIVTKLAQDSVESGKLLAQGYLRKLKWNSSK